ncbi:LysR family transcriptional regulator [Nocardia terrae]|uniref:LysR family transcriptional regulator n=1 Tax=Nocardia terrae TaxID=2675851 RepID=UPI0018DF1989|nr:LysR family transcriptional regulator [Nocardia terrae]
MRTVVPDAGAWRDAPLDFTALRAFLTLSEELHFGRTAQRLSLSQPRVSQLIREMERQIGGALFVRTSRRVRLTTLGDDLLRDIMPAVDRIDRALVAARATTRGLRIGFLGQFASTLDAAIAESRRREPDFAITMTQLQCQDLFGALRRRELDMQVSLCPVRQDDLVAGPVVGEYPRAVAIARAHPLATRRELTLEDLGDIAAVAPAPDTPPELVRSYWPPERTPSGRRIHFAGPARTEAEMLGTVAQGGAVYLTSTAMATHFTHPAVTYLPFAGLPPVRAILVWHQDTRCAKVREFATLAEHAYHANRPVTP